MANTKFNVNQLPDTNEVRQTLFPEPSSSTGGTLFLAGFKDNWNNGCYITPYQLTPEMLTQMAAIPKWHNGNSNNSQIGSWFMINVYNGGYLPSGGTWAAFWMDYSTVSNVWNGGSGTVSVLPGGTYIGYYGARTFGFAWRIS